MTPSLSIITWRRSRWPSSGTCKRRRPIPGSGATVGRRAPSARGRGQACKQKEMLQSYIFTGGVRGVYSPPNAKTLDLPPFLAEGPENLVIKRAKKRDPLRTISKIPPLAPLKKNRCWRMATVAKNMSSCDFLTWLWLGSLCALLTCTCARRRRPRRRPASFHVWLKGSPVTENKSSFRQVTRESDHSY